MKKKILSLILCLFFIFTLTSCKDPVETPPGGDIVEPGTNPGGDTTNPGGDTTNPGGDTTNPGGDTTNPGGDSTNPGGNTTNPGGDSTNPGGNTTNPGGNTTNPSNPENTEDVGFVIHFNISSKDSSGKYKYNIWIWEKTKDGADFSFNGEDEYGVYSKVEFSKFSKNVISNTVGFIIKTNKTWDQGAVKDYDSDRFIDFSSLDKDIYGYYHIWIKSGDKNIYTSPELEVGVSIPYFSITYNEKEDKLMIWFQTSHDYAEFKIYQGEDVLVDHNTDDGNIDRKTSKRFQYFLTWLPDLTKDIVLDVKFKDNDKVLTKTVSKSALYSTKIFEDLYAYDGDLGAIYTKTSTEFKVWSPVSTEIKLRIYDNGTPKSISASNGNDDYIEYKMTLGDKGVWSAKVDGDLAGKYYTYVVTNSTFQDAEIVDPYAKSAGVNGLRGMIVDFDATNPEGWDDVQIHNYLPMELTVYETHIADLTSSSTWGGTSANAKTYKGFYEAGTTYTENGVTVKTGFDHIKELGVNAVQILPFFDSANNEVNKEFNWGYNPLNYNVLDGSYSSNPYDGYTRIREFKELVMAYNEAGINIIMDVVYNHVNGLAGSNFDVLMPGYYFRYANGMPSNGSGCGNETASENYMFRKFMIDSTEFWAKEYKLGGYRFDLMGVHDIETMNQLTNNLHTNVNEHIVVYGEPWAGGTTAIPTGSTAATQANMNQYKGYGCFNDKMRDALIKGGLSSKDERGWITNNSTINAGDITNIKSGLTGKVLSSSSKLEAEKCINYVTCHDNYTLYDRIKAAGISNEATVKKMAMLANSVVFTSQGVTFMLAGEEFLRTKGGNENSYNASYKVNELNYALKVKNYDMFENYQKLIALKQNANLFAKTNENCALIEVKTNSTGSMIYYDLIDEEAGLSYRIIHSNGVQSGEKTVDLEGYTLYLDTLGVDGLQLTSSTTIGEYQTIIAYKNIN